MARAAGVQRAINPAGAASCRSRPRRADELTRDFLWRIHSQVAAAGRDRRVQPLALRGCADRPRARLAGREVVVARYEQINAFERTLAAPAPSSSSSSCTSRRPSSSGRLKDRLVTPHKQWKVNPQDFEERKRWKAVHWRPTRTPWPAARPPRRRGSSSRATASVFRNLAVASIVVEALERWTMKFPPPACDVRDRGEMTGGR